MPSPLSLTAVVATLVLVGSACGAGDADVHARDDGPGSTSPGQLMAVVPEGPVRTANLATVMDTGSPELCLGPVAESYPPQCGGPGLLGWDWSDHKGTYDQQGGVKWGTYLLTGTWDGTSFTATDAVPGAIYDPAMSTPTPTPTPSKTYDAGELEQIAIELRELPWVLDAYGGDGSEGHVLVDVYYDDGTLQDRVDRRYGAGVVLVAPALVDAG